MRLVWIVCVALFAGTPLVAQQILVQNLETYLAAFGYQPGAIDGLMQTAR